MNMRKDRYKHAVTLLLIVILLGSLVGCHTGSTVDANIVEDTHSLVIPTLTEMPSLTPITNTVPTPSPTETPSADMVEVTGDMVVHFIDVGQGDSAFIELPTGQTMLIDAGEEGARVDAYIAGLGYESIDYLVGTHPHSDHIGGMADIIEKFDIGAIFMPRVTHNTQTFEHLLDTISAKGLKINATNVGTTVMDPVDGLSIDVLSPSRQEYDDLNDFSIVLRITYGSKSFLFMGDASANVESELGNVAADVLKAGHHGSSTSSSQQFMQKASPEHVVISCGKDNDYGHPHSEVVELLVNTLSTNVYSTSQSGTIVATTDGNTVSFSSAPNSLAELTVSRDNTTDNDYTTTATNKDDTQQSASSNSGTSEAAGEIKATATPEPDDDDISGAGTYVGSTKSDKYHNPSCRHAKKIKQSNEIWFSSADDAHNHGYVPCKVCRP